MKLAEPFSNNNNIRNQTTQNIVSKLKIKPPLCSQYAAKLNPSLNSTEAPNIGVQSCLLGD